MAGGPTPAPLTVLLVAGDRGSCGPEIGLDRSKWHRKRYGEGDVEECVASKVERKRDPGVENEPRYDASCHRLPCPRLASSQWSTNDCREGQHPPNDDRAKNGIDQFQVVASAIEGDVSIARAESKSAEDTVRYLQSGDNQRKRIHRHKRNDPKEHPIPEGDAPGHAAANTRSSAATGARHSGPIASTRTTTLNNTFHGLPDVIEPMLSRANHASSAVTTDLRTPSGARS